MLAHLYTHEYFDDDERELIMSNTVYHNHMILGFVASDTRTIVYLKQSEETREYAVKVLHKDGTKTVVKTDYSLSSAMREFAETIAQFTGGFTTWKKI